RSLWEQAVSFKIKGLEKDLKRRDEEIETLKNDLEDMSIQLVKPEETKPLPAARKAVRPSATLSATRALGAPYKEAKEEDDYARLTDTVMREMMLRAVREENMTVFLQPFSRLPQRQPLFFEALSRLRAKPG